MTWEDIIKNSPQQKFAKIAEDNGLYNAFEEEAFIILIPIKYRKFETMFYPPTSVCRKLKTFTPVKFFNSFN